MTDLHTHILPDMDDGCRTVEESLQLLAAEREQGVDTVVLTPHFYRSQEESDSFLLRRSRSMDLLQRQLPSDAPALVLGAETAWYASLAEDPNLEKLCLDDRGTLLLELPYTPWPVKMADWLYRFVNDTGLTPILAHIERYEGLQSAGQLRDVMNMGLPMQMSAGVFSSMLRRGKYLRLLRDGQWYIASDCHGMTKRPPCMDVAAAYVRCKLPHAAEQMLTWQPQSSDLGEHS